MCVFIICQALFSGEVTLYFSLLLTLVLHLVSGSIFKEHLVIGGKAGIYAAAWDQTHSKGIGTNNI